jgi:hypothetical protein
VHSVLYTETTPRPVYVLRTYPNSLPDAHQFGDDSSTQWGYVVSPQRLTRATCPSTVVLVSLFLAVSHSAYEKKKEKVNGPLVDR